MVRCSKDTEALEKVKVKCGKSIERLDTEIKKLTKQLCKKLGNVELTDSPDEAYKLNTLVRTDRRSSKLPRHESSKINLLSSH